MSLRSALSLAFNTLDQAFALGNSPVAPEDRFFLFDNDLLMHLRQFSKAHPLKRLRDVNFSFLLPQFKPVAAIGACIAQHLGYAKSIDIVIGLKILSGSN